ncbi:MAG: sensor histidine kinase [Chitinophagaceae bacterium]
MFEAYLNRRNLLVLLALLIAGGALFFANHLTRRLAEEEKKKVELIRQALEVVVKETDDFPLLAFTVIHSNTTIPLINTDAEDHIISYNNIDTSGIGNLQERDVYLNEQLRRLKAMHKPVEIRIDEQNKQYVYYGESALLKQLRYFPYALLLILFVFLVMVVVYVSSSNRRIQDRVWVGMSKETAHQLGTPLNSLVAWLELLKAEQGESAILDEMHKDVNRLQLIADRFSKIGSQPQLHPEDITIHLRDIVTYMEKRASSQVVFDLQVPSQAVLAPISGPLFDWVMENLLRNALDAMSGKGQITVVLSEAGDWLHIDVSDTGKGILPAHVNKVFNPGFSTKKRGWGLGLSLSKRIIHEYHHGQIAVKKSVPGKGTTFRIQLRRTV